MVDVEYRLKHMILMDWAKPLRNQNLPASELGPKITQDL